MQNYAKVGGVLSIISGGIGIFSMLFLIALGVLFAFMPDIFNGNYYYDRGSPDTVFAIIGVVYAVIGFLGMLVSVLAIIGGAFAVKKKHWGLALAGSIAGTLTFFPCGIAAIIFTVMGKPEFGSMAPPPAAPPDKIVG